MGFRRRRRRPWESGATEESLRWLLDRGIRDGSLTRLSLEELQQIPDWVIEQLGGDPTARAGAAVPGCPLNSAASPGEACGGRLEVVNDRLYCQSCAAEFARIPLNIRPRLREIIAAAVNSTGGAGLGGIPPRNDAAIDEALRRCVELIDPPASAD